MYKNFFKVNIYVLPHEKDLSLSIVRDWNLATIWQTIELIIPATDHSTVSIMMQGQHLYLLFCDTKVIFSTFTRRFIKSAELDLAQF